MFSLRRKTLPQTPAELESTLESTLREAFDKRERIVTVRGATLDALDEISVQLDGADLARMPQPPGKAANAGGEQLRVAQLNVGGRGVSLFGARADFSLNATRAVLAAVPDAAGELVLLLHDADEGAFELIIGKAALIQLLENVGRTEAERRGVSLESVDVDWKSRGARAVDLDVRIRARKFFMSASLRLTGSVGIDDDLAATLTNLRCTGEGAIASMACGVLTPHLQRIDGRKFALNALPIGELQLRDVEILAGDRLEVRAKFGSKNDSALPER